MLIDNSNGKFKEICKFAEETNQKEQFEQKIASLCAWETGAWYRDEKGKRETRIFPDFAPYSLYFERYIIDENGKERFVGNGGLIYHGKHDGFGSGEGPTFSCCLTPTSGWSIHT